MKSFGLSLLFWLLMNNIHAQQSFIDSLKKVINKNTQDTNEVNAFVALGNNFPQFTDAVNYATQGLSLAKKINYKKGEADCYLILASTNFNHGNATKAIQYVFTALDDYQALKNNTGIASSNLLMQGIYREAEDYNSSLIHAFTGEKLAEKNNIQGELFFPGHRLSPFFLAEISQTYILKKNLDSAMLYAQKSIKQNELFDGTQWEFPIYLLATIQQMKGDYIHALENYYIAIKLAKVQTENMYDTLQIYSGMSTLFKKTHQFDSSIYYGKIVQTSWKPGISEGKNLLEAVSDLYEVYKLKGEKDSTLKYLELNYNLRVSIFSTEKQKQINEATFNDQLKQQQIIANQIKYNSRLQAYLFTVGIITLLIISGLLIRNNSNNKKAKIKIEEAYTELKSTQAQLIQSEKMASLGELTAGIAHEIQNPLNFVNNFSEVSNELLDEMNEELDKGDISEAKLISNDIKQNLDKINHHGKRADAIVKGMLQHSRQTKGMKEPTNINALCDEFLRLSYHGLRAKDKSFNADFTTDFDGNMGKIKIVPQDMGRVLLNLFNNAFYAVSERRKAEGEGFKPLVSIQTKKINDNIEIKVSDNGNGIPQHIIDKIFQPFFTTKPTGQGTGLGLSLSYDIIKAHGGEIKVESEEGRGSIFTMKFPI